MKKNVNEETINAIGEEKDLSNISKLEKRISKLEKEIKKLSEGQNLLTLGVGALIMERDLKKTNK